MPDTDRDAPSQPLESAGDAAGPPAPRLLVDAVDAFNYAAWQNSVPLLRRVEVDNSSGLELSSLTVELRASPGFVRAKRWTLDRIQAGTKVVLRDTDVEIDPEYLDRLDESERGVLTFTLSHQGMTLAEVTHNVRVLARDEWGGLSAMGELLPAFVTPNDPALAGLLKSAAAVLGDSGQSTALNGYQSGDPNRAYLLAAALWSAVGAKSLTYANPPASFEAVGQKVRRVGTVLGDGLATCLDSTLLFASGLEAIGLNPVVVMTSGHCFTGVWLVSKSFTQPLERDCGEVRKAIAARELVVFETTLITHRPPAVFPDAVAIATTAVSVEKEHDFVALIDIARGRMSQVRPLATRGERLEQAGITDESGPLPLPAAPGFDHAAVQEVEEIPQTPVGRIERWQRKLLDLSLRNRLLNFRPSKQIVPVLCPDLSRLEDHLADGKRVRLISLPDSNPLGQRDAELHQRRTSRDLDWEFARKALGREELTCPLTDRELSARLTALYRKVRNDLSEGGSNTLYLAVGFLRWKQKATDDATYRAPLLLVPVTLTRRSASSPFHLAGHEDEVRFNATLLQLLKKDFACDLSRFETELPTDDSGVDVPLVLERMRQAVREIPGFEVLEEAAIATFSFAKYLMWRDLVDRVGQLEQNRVVRHLIHNPDKPFSSGIGSAAPQPHDIDTRYLPKELVHPLPADSSQLAVVMAAAEGHDMVIVGPPGTGKSQTIANLIAQCLSMRKTVLFVAEKTAALDVVHRRLRQHGLGDCCVELHSNKAERQRFLGQLDASWRNRRDEADSDWLTISERLRVRRDQLNEYATAIHKPEPNGWTPYEAMGEWLRGRDQTVPRLDWKPTVRHDRATYLEFEATVSLLASTFQVLNTTAEPLRVQTKEWSLAWETSLLDACRRLADASDSFGLAVAALFEMLGLPSPAGISSGQVQQLYKLARELSQADLPPMEILLHERIDVLQQALRQRIALLQEQTAARIDLCKEVVEFHRLLGSSAADGASLELPESLDRLLSELEGPKLPPAALVFHPRFDALEAGLSERSQLLESRTAAREALVARSFSHALLDRIPIDEIEGQWTSATRTYWPLTVLMLKTVKSRLQAFMMPAGKAAPEVDLPLLCEYRDTSVRLGENIQSLALPAPLQKAIEQDVRALDDQLHSARQLRSAMVAAGFSPESAGQASGGGLDRLVAAAKRLKSCRTKLTDGERRLNENLTALGLPPALLSLVEADGTALDAQMLKSQALRDAMDAALGEAGEHRSTALRTALNASEKRRLELTNTCCQAAKSFHATWQAYSEQAGQTAVTSESATLVADAALAARQVIARRTELKTWTTWRGAQSRAAALGLSSFVAAFQAGELDATNAMDRFRLAYARWWLPTVMDRVSSLRGFQRFLHEEAVSEFQRLDELARKAAAPQVRHAIRHGLPAMDEVPRQSELGVLRHQLGLKRPNRSIREVITNMPQTFAQLAPCVLMSPLSVAQYLPVNHPQFDVVVFDEASQITTWDAIGAIARGRQTIIVGDPKQLPPTNFFGTTDSDEANEDLEDHEKDLESILDEARNSGLPTLQLNWHYRSRHESLIAFSNWNYYGNNLVTFPAAESTDRGVSLRQLTDAIYDRGKSRTNRKEAEAIVADAVERMRRGLRQPEDRRSTFGVVTFNSQQQEMIQDLFDAALRDHPELEWYFADDRIEPTMVKNLENVQGDERDVMLFSITFGFDAAGKFPADFGALNRDGGERRLNVAITRARCELVVYCSFHPDQLRAERSSKRGVHDLKAFLHYADKGPAAMLSRTDGSVGEYESPLEEVVASTLKQKGWLVDPQVGVSGFRIDLGVIHPDRPGAYLAGIECDGATYHRAAAARDRDKIRQQVLEGLGWKILRVWSTDWWYDPDTAMEQIDRSLHDLLARDRAVALEQAASPDLDAIEEPAVIFQEFTDELPVDDQQAPYDAAIDLTVGAMRNVVTDLPKSDPVEDVKRDEVPGGESTVADSTPCESTDIAPEITSQKTASVGSQDALPTPTLVARQFNQSDRVYYRRVELNDATANQGCFFDEDYSFPIQAMARAIIEAQGPIREDVLVREVARAHGFARTGGRIAQRVLDVVSDVTETVEPVGRFFWPGPAADTIPFRFHRVEGDRRSLDEIALPELVGLVRAYPALSECDDPALALAREIGLGRLARSARDRLELALGLVRGDVTANDASSTEVSKGRRAEPEKESAPFE
jgi:hypothetical protein